MWLARVSYFISTEIEWKQPAKHRELTFAYMSYSHRERESVKIFIVFPTIFGLHLNEFNLYSVASKLRAILAIEYMYSM